MKPLRIGLAGLGTIGCGLLAVLRDRQMGIRERAGRAIEIKAVCARRKTPARETDFGALRWYDDPVELAQDPDIDVFIEAIGGADGPAHDAVKAALQAGKHVVTANKALLATHGVALAALAEEQGVALAGEAAVAGGIPALKALGEGLVGNSIDSVSGILNGTCNYILARMEETGRDFDDVLKEAQELGYAEADPAFDIDGVDAAHKLALLAALAFGEEPNMAGLEISGIRGITCNDLSLARELGGCIKLIAKATIGRKPTVEMLFLPSSHGLAQVAGVTNAVAFSADKAGFITINGPGAGGFATGSALAADIVDIARGSIRPFFGCPAGNLVKSEASQKPAYRQVFLRCGRRLAVPDGFTVLKHAEINGYHGFLLQAGDGIDAVSEFNNTVGALGKDMLLLPAEAEN